MHQDLEQVEPADVLTFTWMNNHDRRSNWISSLAPEFLPALIPHFAQGAQGGCVSGGIAATQRAKRAANGRVLAGAK